MLSDTSTSHDNDNKYESRKFMSEWARISPATACLIYSCLFESETNNKQDAYRRIRSEMPPYTVFMYAAEAAGALDLMHTLRDDIEP